MTLFTTLKTRIFDALKVWPLYCLPKHALSRIVYRLTRIEHIGWKNFLINSFIALYKIDMSQAIWHDAKDYASFNAFFTRKLKPDVRHWQKDSSLVLSPVDGFISQIGNINDARLIQAKGKTYSLASLLANDLPMAEQFSNGAFTTLYLSPRDYHRIHMPVSGKLVKSIYVPGELFPVNTASVRTVDSLFARNERFISLFETDSGLMAQIMVGAIFVGSMETVWAGQITPTDQRQLRIEDHTDSNIVLNQADEFGHFNMGSTVILLFEKESISWLDSLHESNPIQVGQILGKTGTH
jgi:phosphatidylserine decarboxylase